MAQLTRLSSRQHYSEGPPDCCSDQAAGTEDGILDSDSTQTPSEITGQFLQSGETDGEELEINVLAAPPPEATVFTSLSVPGSQVLGTRE